MGGGPTFRSGPSFARVRYLYLVGLIFVEGGLPAKFLPVKQVQKLANFSPGKNVPVHIYSCYM